MLTATVRAGSLTNPPARNLLLAANPGCHRMLDNHLLRQERDAALDTALVVHTLRGIGNDPAAKLDDVPGRPRLGGELVRLAQVDTHLGPADSHSLVAGILALDVHAASRIGEVLAQERERGVVIRRTQPLGVADLARSLLVHPVGSRGTPRDVRFENVARRVDAGIQLGRAGVQPAIRRLRGEQRPLLLSISRGLHPLASSFFSGRAGSVAFTVAGSAFPRREGGSLKLNGASK